MQQPESQRVKRSQRDYILAFKLAIVSEVARGELSKKQAKHRYGIQGRSTVLVWCRKYATHLATFQQAGPTSPAPSRPWSRPRSGASKSWRPNFLAKNNCISSS